MSLKFYVLIFIFFSFQLSAKAIHKDHKMQNAQKIIEQFYEYFNTSQLDKLFSLIDDNIVHEINYDGPMEGKNAFIDYISYNKKHFTEEVYNCVIMVSEDGRFAAANFRTRGKYVLTDTSNIPAIGQPYELSVMNYFEIENGKITKAKCWFDENTWKQQIE